ncbi:MAG: PHP domain-containing protein [Clostridia bacterium]|nr:PHP domain-containing protein [Clostridia bacterium]
MYKIELHAHTKPISGCGQLTPEELVKAYKDVGYSGIVIANHFTNDFFIEESEEELQRYMTAYKEAEEAGEKYGVKIFWGAEFRFSPQIQDFLVYGVTESLLRKMMHAFDYTFEEFRALVKSEGGLFVQAHPFRHLDLIIPLTDLDGIELYNMHAKHNSKNDLTELLLTKYKVGFATSGSDCHEYDSVGRGGILCEKMPENNAELCDILRNREYELIRNYDFNYEKEFLGK